MAQALPEYPEKLDFTMNGEKELPGVTTRQGLSGGAESLHIDIKGTCDADNITVTFATPEGWDSLMIMDMWGEGEISTIQTRSDSDWLTIEAFENMSYHAGNSVTYVTDGQPQDGGIALVKDGMVYAHTITYYLEVEKDSNGGGSDDTLIPSSIGVTVFAEGLTVDQEQDPSDGSIYINVTGAIAEEEYDMVLDIPEGWDGFVLQPFSDYVTVGDHGIGPKKISATDHDWTPIEDFLEEGYIKGNKLTFKATGNWEFVYAYLYKGEQVDYNAYIGITSKVSQETYKVSTSCPSLEVVQGDYGGLYSVIVTGECPDNEYTVTVETPEGYDGFIGYSDCDYSYDIEPLKKIQDPEWVDVEDLLEDGLKITNSLTFPADGEEHYGQFIPYKGDVADIANAISIEVLVTKAEGSDIKAENQKAYEEVIAQLDALKEQYDAAVAEIKETNPDFDFSEWEEIGNMIESYKEWAAQALAAANEEGEAFMFPFDGAEIEGYISMMLMEANPAPEFPTSFDVTLSSYEGVELTTDDSQGVFIINVSGKSTEEEITVTIAVPEGFDGVLHISELDMMDPGIGGGPLSTRAEEADWYPVSWVLEEGMKEGNYMTFPVDGNHYAGQFFLCKNGLVDLNNQVNVEFEVEYATTTGVSGVNAAENAAYYDLQGNRTAKPVKGIYIKVVDGNAAKIVVK
ncbi:MAG: hypothetical protein K2L00_09460, partial [Muribaculaceae bacterium]|nr:hypothetical protein [Muribaculaceae bacterium]